MYPLTLCTAAALPMMSYEVEVPPVVHGTWNTMCDDRDMCQEEGEEGRKIGSLLDRTSLHEMSSFNHFLSCKVKVTLF